MTLYVASFEAPFRLAQHLSDQDEVDVKSSLRLLRRFLDHYSPYATLLRNYMELDGNLQAIDQEFRSNPPGFRTAHQLDVMILEANRLMMNFLAGARSYLDILPQRLEVSAPQTALRLRAWCSVQYEASASYRIFENLRNVSQHRDLPIRAYSAIQRRRDDGSVELSQQLMIDRETFIESGIQAPIRDELARWNGNIPVHDHLRRYFEGLGHVQLQVLRDVIGPYRIAAETIRRYVGAVENPNEAPIYFFEAADPAQISQLEIGVLDPHPHSVLLIEGAVRAVGMTDFGDLDRAAAVHPRWPG